jgi:SAM-dependent methyltransferase
MSIKDAAIRAFWGDEFYRLLLQPFDRHLVDPQPSGAFDPANLPLNKVCRVADGGNPQWRRGYDDLGFPASREVFHRKIWEFNQALYGLRTLRRLAPEATALGIGCGHEELMYFLANRIGKVVATDLYEGGYLGGEGEADVLQHPAKYAPFRFREDHLEVRQMNALALQFEAGSFDFVFCLSSLEHFGSNGDKLTALREMHRVLKPGGVAVLTTEIVLNRLGRGSQYFQRDTLTRLIGAAGFALDGAVDFCVEQEYSARPLALPMDAFAVPHVVLRNFHTIYTSIALFLMKPPGPDPARNARIADEVDEPSTPYRYGADIVTLDPPDRVKPGEQIGVTMSVRNTGDAVWYASNSISHMVRLGVWFSTRDGRNLTGEPERITLPRDVGPDESVTVQVTVGAPAVLGPGRVQMHVGLVKEQCFWFRDKGSADYIVSLEAVSALLFALLNVIASLPT